MQNSVQPNTIKPGEVTSAEHSPIVSRAMGLITLCRNFVYWTQSWRILSIIAWRRSFLWRSLWNVVLVGTLAAFILQSVQLVQDYLQYQRTTNIQNPFKASKVNESEALQTLLNAYAYVVQKKQQSQAAASSSGGLEIGKRRRRQTGGEGKAIDCPVKEEADTTSGHSYERFDCTNGRSILRFVVCPNTDPRPYDSQWYAASDLDAFQPDFAKAFYQCLESDVCISTQCKNYSSGLDMLTKLDDCAVNKVGLSPYPPPAGSNNVIALLAQTVAAKCEFPDAGCHLGTYKKPSTTYPGNFIYKACPADSSNTKYTLTISIDSCNNSAPINNTHTYDENTCKYPTYIDTMVQRVSSALDASQCFANCTAPCTYSETDSCQGALYEDLLCQIQGGNGTCTTSTSLWSTTPMETTVLSTITGPPTTTATTSTPPTTTDVITTTYAVTTTLEATASTAKTSLEASTSTTTLAATTTTEASTMESSTTQTTITPLSISTSDATTPQTTDITTSEEATALEATSTVGASTVGSSTAQTMIITSSTKPLSTSTSTLSSIIPTLSSIISTKTTSTVPATSSTTKILTSTTTGAASTKSSTANLTTSSTTKTTASTTPESSSASTLATYTTATAAATSTSSTSIRLTTTATGQSSSDSTTDVTPTTTASTTSSVSAAETTIKPLTSSTRPAPSTPRAEETSTTSEPFTTLTTADIVNTTTPTLVPPTTIITLEASSTRQTTTAFEGTESTISTTTSSTSSFASTPDVTTTTALSTTSLVSTDATTNEALITSTMPSQSASTSHNGASTSTRPRTTEEITSQSSGMRTSIPLPSTSTTTLSSSTVDAKPPSDGTLSTPSSKQRTLSVSSTVMVPKTSAIRTTTETLQSSSTRGTMSSAAEWASNLPSSPPSPTSRISSETVTYSTSTVGSDATGTTTSTTGSHPGSTASVGVTEGTHTSPQPLPSPSSVPTQTSTSDASVIQSLTKTHTTGANSDASTKSTNIASLMSSTTSAESMTQPYPISTPTKMPVQSSTYALAPATSSQNPSLEQSSTQYFGALSSAMPLSTKHAIDDLHSSSTDFSGTVSTAGIGVPTSRMLTLRDDPVRTTDTHTVFSTGLKTSLGISASITSTSSSRTTGGTQNGPANTTPSSGTEGTKDRSSSSHSTRATGDRRVTQSGNGLVPVDDDFGTTAEGLVSKTIETTPNAQFVPSSGTATVVNPEKASDYSSNSDEEKTTTTPASSVGRTTLVGSEVKIPASFNISDLTPSQVKLLDDVADVYGLNSNDSMPTIEANLLQAMIVVASRMTQAERDKLGFTLRDLVSSCIIDREPCDMDNDFQQSFDVNYGNCYTFNYAYQPKAKYVTKRTGSAAGLKMTVFSNSSEYLATSSTQGVKVLVHTQETQPFPNVQGYMASVGSHMGIVVTNNKFARLGEPYSNCSTLESLAATNQPFYYNGSYSIEGCFRSCFQQKIVSACGCADSRFPLPEEDGIEYCTPLDDTQRICYVDYIAKHGDYYSVANCSCYEPCKDSVYSVRMFVADWPTGDFFYGGLCPKARRLSSSDCAEYYRENSATVEVYFAQLGYRLLEERPRTTIPGLIRNMAGNTGLWIGLSVASVGEFILCGVQILLWLCTKTKELPEVPSCRRRNYAFKGGDDKKEEDDVHNPAKSDELKSSDAECVTVAQSSSLATVSFAEMFEIPQMAARHRLSPKGFPNCHPFLLLAYSLMYLTRTPIMSD